MQAKMNPPRSAGRRRASGVGLDPSSIDDLVAANRTLASLCVLDAFGHVSVRDPRNPNRYLMSRSIAPESVTAGDILVLDLDSQIVDPKDEGKLLYRERFIHGEIYKVRPDVNAVVHSHSPTVVPFTVTRAKLRPLRCSRFANAPATAPTCWSKPPIWARRWRGRSARRPPSC
jgi:ribulose-5-phosphate 4-epimerase/fuculose-1-phosphate aldolase